MLIHRNTTSNVTIPANGVYEISSSMYIRTSNGVYEISYVCTLELVMRMCIGTSNGSARHTKTGYIRTLILIPVVLDKH